MSDSNDTELADIIFLNADFAVPPKFHVKAVGERILISVGEAPHLFTFSISRDTAEKFGEDLDDAIGDVDGESFGPVRTFGFKFDDVNRTAHLTVTE